MNYLLTAWQTATAAYEVAAAAYKADPTDANEHLLEQAFAVWAEAEQNYLEAR